MNRNLIVAFNSDSCVTPKSDNFFRSRSSNPVMCNSEVIIITYGSIFWKKFWAVDFGISSENFSAGDQEPVL
jgi:hypothetical protein